MVMRSNRSIRSSRLSRWNGYRGLFILLAFHRAVLQITDKVADHNRQPPGRFHNTLKRALADIPP